MSDMPPFVSPSQRCVGCTARMAACVSGPTPAPVLRAGWADSVRNVSIRQTFFTTQELACRKVFADLLVSISCHPQHLLGHKGSSGIPGTIKVCQSVLKQNTVFSDILSPSQSAQELKNNSAAVLYSLTELLARL